MTEAPIEPAARTKRQRRRRTTRKSVHTVERFATVLITTGGLATIAAVATICVFLVYTVLPLFSGATVVASASAPAALPGGVATLHGAIDEQRRLVWSLLSDGTLELHRLDTGALVERRTLFDGRVPTCSARNAESDGLVFGFDDGTLRLGRVSFATSYVGEADASEELRALPIGGLAAESGGIVERTREGGLRRQTLEVRLEAPLELGATPLRVGRADSPRGPTLCALTADNRLVVLTIATSVNMLTDEETFEVSRCEPPFRPALDGETPLAVEMLGGGDNVLAIWRDGACVRFDVRDFDAPQEAERFDLLPEPGVALTCLDFLPGKRTLIVGDSAGRVRGWFRTKSDDAGTVDGARMRCGHDLAPCSGAATALAPAPASRLFAVGDASGAVHLLHMTSEKLLASRQVGAEPILALALAPRADALVARSASALACLEVAAGHPEVSAAALFRPVWYENYPAAAHVWQSSSGTDDFEPKLGLMPLVFGTLKATLYSLLFGVPLALLAAVFSSEFLEPRLRVPIKSTIEIMASLPSVVLGFLAAIVIAPLVQQWLPAVLTAFYVLPLALLLGAHLWQLVPQRIALRLGGTQRFALIASALPLGLGAALVLGPWVEAWLFAGDIEAWLDGRVGGALGGWIFLLLPVCAAATTLLSGRVVDPRLRRASAGWSRARCARFDLARFGAAALFAGGLAVLVGGVLAALGADPRGSVVDTYAQRNALIVGFLMGFAIIPIIYTLAEDALTSVPGHLRLASLAAGATPWQTAMRVIVPTAASGLFSAVMVGLGRAVGETMIVLMAAGNTPVMQWNIFNGFRTLSANIAVELPEAVDGSTHYRTLFLAALALFAMTFAVNTAAELVRQRFRRRAFQL